MLAADVRPHIQPGESVACVFRPSWWGLVPVALSTLVALVGFLFAASEGYRSPSVVQLPGALAFLVALAGFGADFVRKAMRVLFTAYVVTDRRFYAVTSFFTTTVQSVPLSRVTTVRLRQGPLMRVLGLWSARVNAYGEAGTSLRIPAVRDGERLLAETSAGLRRGANAAWLLRGD